MAIAADLDADRLRDRRRDQLWVAHRRQRDEVHPTIESVDQVGRDLKAEACLAHAARPGEREQPCVPQQLLGLLDVALAPDEAGQLGRQIVGRRLERAQRREVVRRSVDHELEESLRTGQVLQAMHPEVADRKPRRKAALDQTPRRLREHDLAAVRRRGHPRRVMDVEADVFLADERGLARVHADAHADRLPFRPLVTRELALRLRRGPAPVDRRLEDAEERVALCPQLAAISAAERCAQDRVMLDLRIHVLVTELLHETRGTLDVGEEESDCAGRQAHWTEAATDPSFARMLPSCRWYSGPSKSRSGCGGSRCSEVAPRCRR